MTTPTDETGNELYKFTVRGHYFFGFDDSVLPDVRIYDAQTDEQAVERAKKDGLVWLTSAYKI